VKKLSDFEFAAKAREAAAILESIEAKLDAIDLALDAHVGAKQAA
jgi:hypothetical protein